MIRFPELLGARGMLALGVMMCHTDIRPLLWLMTFMDCFFILSAFLITLGLLESRAPTVGTKLRSFYVRRVARIFPAYYALLIAVGCLLIFINIAGPSLGLKSYSLKELVPYFFYVQFTDLYGSHNELMIWDGSLRFIIHTWSLAIEEQFYVIWGLLFCLAYKPWMKIAVALGFIVAGIWARASGLVVSPLILYRLDAFGYGIAMAMFYFYAVKQGHVSARLFAYCGAMAGFLAFSIFVVVTDIPGAWSRWWLDDQAIEYFQWTPMTILSSFGSAALLLAVICGSGSRWLQPFRSAPALYLGQISYCLYLVHYPIFDVLLYVNHRILPIGHMGNVLVAFSLSIGTAHFATKFFNRVQKRIVDWGDPRTRKVVQSLQPEAAS